MAVLKKDLPVAARAGKRRGEAQGGGEEGRDAPKADAKKGAADGEGQGQGQGDSRKEAGEGRRSTSTGIGQRILALPVPAKNYIAHGRGQGRHRSSCSRRPQAFTADARRARPRTPSTSST
ncbi:MAG: hypothetical protein MZU91_11500 [Desulfosudis oleivorans]|nr:hypothetical protein [Desulfosudis oleivorans]